MASAVSVIPSVSRESSSYSLSDVAWPLHKGSSGVWQPPPQQEPPRQSTQQDLKHKSKQAWVDAWRSLLDATVCRARVERKAEGDDGVPDPGSSPVTRVATAAELDHVELGGGEAAAAPTKTAVRVVAVGA